MDDDDGIQQAEAQVQQGQPDEAESVGQKQVGFRATDQREDGPQTRDQVDPLQPHEHAHEDVREKSPATVAPATNAATLPWAYWRHKLNT
ncbi:MAG: hypothetical protein R2708_02470 [Vicinamibacterales bacterium]